ncbi:MAG: hypothetical protein ACR2ME_11390 [Acidimicrobiia bacterium]
MPERITLQFKGSLRSPGDRGPGIRVSLEVDSYHLQIHRGSELMGRWYLADVEAVRDVAERFTLFLGEDEMQFLADDALVFAYEGLTQMQQAWVNAQKRKRRHRRAAEESARRKDEAPEEPLPTPEPSTRPVKPPTSELAKKLAAIAAAEDAAEVAQNGGFGLPSEESVGGNGRALRRRYEALGIAAREAQEVVIPVEPDPEVAVPVEPVAPVEPTAPIEVVAPVEVVEPVAVVEPEIAPPEPALASEPVEVVEPVAVVEPEIASPEPALAPVQPVAVVEPDVVVEPVAVVEAEIASPEPALAPVEPVAVVEPDVVVEPPVPVKVAVSVVADSAVQAQKPLELRNYGHHPLESSTGLLGKLRRAPKIAESHEHVYQESRSVFGLMRRVCVECSYVSISTYD